MPSAPLLRALLVALPLAFCCLAKEAAAEVQLASHRATYALSLDAASKGGRFTGVRGTMSMQLERTCEGWIVGQNMLMAVATAEGEEVKQGVRYTGWESSDGLRFRFVGRSQTDGKTTDSKGEAKVPAAKASGAAVFTHPESKTVNLPAGTLFPVAHTVWLIEQAAAGKRQAPATVFDGAGGEGPQNASAFIGNKVEPMQHGKVARGPLTDRQGWRMRLAFFPAESNTPAPEYEVDALQIDNGVVPRLVIHFPEFSVAMDLETIEPIAAPSC